MMNRRDFLKRGIQITGAAGVLGLTGAPLFSAEEPLYKVSLAQWSLNNSIFDGDVDNLEFAPMAKEKFGIDAVEYVNQFFKDKANNSNYLRRMKQAADDAGVQSLLIMCDGEGRLGDPDDQKRAQAVENHFKWLEAAQFLGCHSIRVNAASEGSWDEQMKLAADGLRSLTEEADQYNLNVIVENHGGLSSNGDWLTGVMDMVSHPHCGTLPDFGNFRVSDGKMYNRYEGVAELMRYAKAVSAKSHEFDDQGNEVHTDYNKMMRIVVGAGYHGYVGIEYEGSQLSEPEGIMATKELLLKVRDQLAREFA
jgi:sugar phosphate isomerase/epimerase